MERNINLLFFLVINFISTITSYSQVSRVEVTTNSSGNFELQRNGVPYYIKRLVSKDHFDLLVNSGGKLYTSLEYK